MQRWAPDPADRPSRQRTDDAQLLTPSQDRTPGNSADHSKINDEDQNPSSSHVYHSVDASGNANLHLGDVHYHSSQPDVSVREQLLSSLHFRQMFMRFDNIDDPHSDTFKWIFEPPGDKQPKWDSFTEWLNGDGGLYWVSGKPGSGKSVLMKYLVSNFQQSLRPDENGVISLSFWFWEAAHTELERNMLGCLRSLLWQLLQFPECSGSIVRAIKNSLPFEWTEKRLRDAFEASLRDLPDAGVQVLIFLDGLDESRSDATAVMKYALDIAKRLPPIKICVSSRPEPILQLSLERYPHLKMQNLNQSDVHAIIQQDLLDAPEFSALSCKGVEIDLLRIRIVQEAQGVLLWVRLVIRDLVQGIAEGNTFSKLLTRLEDLPAELDGEQGLYSYMLRRNAKSSKIHLADTALYLQIACRDRTSSVLEHYLMTDDGMRNAYLQFKNGWEDLHHQLDCIQLTRAITARTRGLLEVVVHTEIDDDTITSSRTARTRDPALTNLLSSNKIRKVEFLHRTVRSYILETLSGQELLTASQKSPSEVEGLAFEAWMISDVVLPCLESVTPVNSTIFSTFAQWTVRRLSDVQIQPGIFKTVVESLAEKGYLWLESCPTGLNSIQLQRGWSYNWMPFTKTDHGQVLFEQVFAYHGWSCIFNELQHMEDLIDPAVLLCVLFDVLMGTAEEIARHPSSESTKVRKKCIELLLQDQRKTNYVRANKFDEQISIFHHILMGWFNWVHRMEISELPTLKDWLRQAHRTTNTNEFRPSMTACSLLFFRDRGEEEQTVFFLGTFDYMDLLADDTTDFCEPERAALSRSYLLCRWHKDTWKPTMHVSPLEGSGYCLKLRPHDGLVNVGIVEYSATEGSTTSGTIPKLQDQPPEMLRSLIDVFRHLGKSEAQIQNFIKLEEPRIKQTYDEIIYHHWREWLYGIEEPYLEPYRCVPRPSILYLRLGRSWINKYLKKATPGS